MHFNKNIFISHASANKEIAEQLSAYLTRLGVKEQNIFCSSIIGQGVANGEKLNVAIGAAMKKSNLIIFLLSRDFIHSSYCMEELGAGWYLNQHKQTTCFYLVLPDLELSELNGFVNSKVDKFSFVTPEHKDDLGLLAVDVAKRMRLRIPEHHLIVNASKTFFSAIQQQLNDLTAQAEEEKIAEEARKQEVAILKQKIEQQTEIIEKQKQDRRTDYERIEKEKRKVKYDTIDRLFNSLGLSEGLNKQQIDALEKGFWFDMLNEYVELEKEFGSNDADMQKVLANIYSSEGYLEEAYQRMLKYIELSNSNIYPYYFDNIKIDTHNNAEEAIDLLKKKLENEPLGIVYDSYKETLSYFERRKNKSCNTI